MNHQYMLTSMKYEDFIKAIELWRNAQIDVLQRQFEYQSGLQNMSLRQAKELELIKLSNALKVRGE